MERLNRSDRPAEEAPLERQASGMTRISAVDPLDEPENDHIVRFGTLREHGGVRPMAPGSSLASQAS
jgi:hypothetical protein